MSTLRAEIFKCLLTRFTNSLNLFLFDPNIQRRQGFSDFECKIYKKKILQAKNEKTRFAYSAGKSALEPLSGNRIANAYEVRRRCEIRAEQTIQRIVSHRR